MYFLLAMVILLYKPTRNVETYLSDAID